MEILKHKGPNSELDSFLVENYWIEIQTVNMMENILSCQLCFKQPVYYKIFSIIFVSKMMSMRYQYHW